MARNMRREIKVEQFDMGYRCLCCFDTGLVRYCETLIPDYEYSRDVPLVCTRPGCQSASTVFRVGTPDPTGKGWDTREHLNNTATEQECQWLHEQALEEMKRIPESRISDVHDLMSKAVDESGSIYA